MSEPVIPAASTRRWLPRFAAREMELPDEHAHADHDHHHEGEWKRQLLASVLVSAPQRRRLSRSRNRHWRSPAFIGAYLAGGWFTAQEIVGKSARGEVDVHFLMLAVAAGAAAIGKWGEGSVLLFLFSFSGALEHFAMERTQREIRSLFKAAPKTAIVLRDGRRGGGAGRAIAQPGCDC